MPKVADVPEPVALQAWDLSGKQFFLTTGGGTVEVFSYEQMLKPGVQHAHTRVHTRAHAQRTPHTHPPTHPPTRPPPLQGLRNPHARCTRTRPTATASSSRRAARYACGG